MAEILAPCGSMDALVAAVRCGATAVYLGSGGMNARQGAQNFDAAALSEAVSYCHARGVRVHLALNILVHDTQLSEVEQALRQAAALGVDALIIQDLGVFSMAKAMLSGVQLHASTQLSIHTPAGLRQIEALGFHRCVLARELSRKELLECRASSRLPLEVFVHGALCMSVSGQCYLSAMLGSRSGNRGLCAQPCRLPFYVKEKGGHDLSLKDLSLIKKARQLSELGVDSLKIEGRMKRPEYVAAAVTACRQALEGDMAPELEQQLESVFSRSGFTDGYYTSRRTGAMFGYRRKEDVTRASPVLRQLARLYDREVPLVPCSFAASVLAGEPVFLSASARGKTVYVQEEYLPQAAVHMSLTQQALRARLEKCGGTPFFIQSIDLDFEEGLMVPASVINSLRRRALDALLEQLGSPLPHPFSPLPEEWKARAKAKKTFSAPCLTARFSSAGQLPCDLSALRRIYVPLETPADALAALLKRHPNVGVELPRGMFGREREIREMLQAAREAGAAFALCGNLGGVLLAKEAGLEIHGDFGLNITNSYALETLRELGAAQAVLSFEMTLEQVRALGGSLPRGILAYGRLPLMLLRNCPVSARRGCKECRGNGTVTDRLGISFPVRCRLGCSELLNSRPLYLADRLEECRGVDFFQLYFTTEPPEECAQVIQNYRQRAPAAGEFTRGLYYRGVE